MTLISLLVRRMEEAADNVAGLLPRMLRDSGFEGVEEARRFSLPYGTLSFYRAWKPARSPAQHAGTGTVGVASARSSSTHMTAPAARSG